MLTFAQVILISVTPMLLNLRIGAREAGRDKLKEKNKAAFFSPSENRCLPASSLKPEGREFVVDSGTSMHMISKKDLNSAEWIP